MKVIRYAWLLLVFSMAGCAGNSVKGSLDTVPIDVFGVTLYFTTDYLEIKGVKGSDEPCLRGYERSFDPLDVVIGYGTDGRIRKVTIRNPRNSILGIHPGETAESARKKIVIAGFLADSSPGRFRKGDLLLALREDEQGKISGLTLEHFE